MINLAEAVIGRTVIYQAHPGAPLEVGVVTNVGDRYVHVRYEAWAAAKATRPEDLWPATPELLMQATGSYDEPDWQRCPVCLISPEPPEDREPIAPGDEWMENRDNPRRCPACGMVPSGGGEGARRVAAARGLT